MNKSQILVAAAVAVLAACSMAPGQTDQPGPANTRPELSRELGPPSVLAARRKLVGRPVPDFRVTGTEGQLLSPAAFQGKVVLLDFWGGAACAPCLVEMSDIAKLYAQHHDAGFEVLGVAWTMGFEGGAGVHANLTALEKKYRMTWPEYCDGEPGRAGDPHTNILFDTFRVAGGGVPANYLVGRDGKIIAMDLHGDSLSNAVARAMAAPAQ